MVGSLPPRSLSCKKGSEVELKKYLKAFVRDTVGDQSARAVSDDLVEFETVRDEAVALSGSLHDARKAIARYLRYLALAEPRFDASRRHVPGLKFVWHDAFKPSRSYEQGSLAFDRAAALFNFAAVCSQLGCKAPTPRERLDAFAQAAGTLSLLRTDASLKCERPSPADFEPAVLDAFISLFLGFAQEAAEAIAALDNKSARLRSRLLAGAASRFREAAGLFAQAPCAGLVDATLGPEALCRAAIADARVLELDGEVARAADELKGTAPVLVRLRMASDGLADARKAAGRAAGPDALRVLADLEADLTTRIQRADRDNNNIYMQRVPKPSEVDAVEPALTVRPVTPSELQPTADEARRLFRAVATDESTRLASRYSELVDAFVRQQVDRLTSASNEARLRLREWELPESLAALDPGSTTAVPEAVRVELEQIEREGGVNDLRELVAEIGRLRSTALEEVAAADAELVTESRADAAARARYGDREWTPAPSAQLTGALRARLDGYRANLVAAGESDARLSVRLEVIAEGSDALSPAAAAALMPALPAPVLAVDASEPVTQVATLRGALARIQDLSTERAALEQALQDAKKDDDPLPDILACTSFDAPAAPAAAGPGGAAPAPGQARPGSAQTVNVRTDPDGFLRARLEKRYGPIREQIDRNLELHERLLKATGETQATFKETYGFEDWRRACGKAVEGLRRQAKEYRDLRSNLGEAVSFYTGLHEALSALRQQLGDYVLTRKLQRDELVEDLDRRAQAVERARRDQEAAARLAGLHVGAGPTPQAGQPSAYPSQAGYPTPQYGAASQGPYAISGQQAYGQQQPQQPQQAYGQQQPQQPQQAAYGGHSQTLSSYGSQMMQSQGSAQASGGAQAHYGAPSLQQQPQQQPQQPQGYAQNSYIVQPGQAAPQQQQQQQQQPGYPQPNYAQNGPYQTSTTQPQYGNATQRPPAAGQTNWESFGWTGPR